MEFRWIEWNLEHATSHGVSREEIEYVVNNATRPYPEPTGDEKWLVRGPTAAGWMVQVIYLLDNDYTAFVIHARPLTEREKRRYRRQKKR